MPSRAEHGRIDLAHRAEHVAGDDDLGRPGRVQAGQRGLAQRCLVDAQRVDQHEPDLDGRPGVAPGEHHAEHLALVGELLAVGWRQEGLADLEEPDVVAAMRHVVGDALEQSGAQRRPQDGLLGSQGVGQRDADVGEARAGQVVGCEERQRHGLVEADTEHGLAHQPPGLLAGCERTGPDARRDPPRDVAVAEVTGDLLDHVDLGGGVGPEASAPSRAARSRRRRPGRDLEPDRAEQPGDVRPR